MAYAIEPPIFDDRYDAGRELAERLEELHDTDTVVLGILHGGVPVAFPIALHLQCRLDITMVRAIPAPSNPTISLGAVAEDGSYLANDPLVARLNLSFRDVPKLTTPVHHQMIEDLRVYRGHRPRPSVTGRRVVLADDGTAGEFELLAAASYLLSGKPASLVVAVPVIAARLLHQVQRLASDVVALVIRHNHGLPASSFYRAWEDVSDDEVLELLRESAGWST